MTADSDFRFANDPLKHFVRLEGWLPMCRQRLKELNTDRPKNKGRRLRYFTFCATSAIDVLMLHIHRIIRRTKQGDFDTVCFFNDTDRTVSETLRTIPGASGFAGNFVRVVLADTGEDGADVVQGEQDDSEANEESAYVELKNLRDDQRQLVRRFPFDVVNLDLERHFFRPREVPPGDLVKAIRKVLAWQTKPIIRDSGKEYLRAFTLFITMRVGPANMGEGHLDMLQGTLRANIDRDPTLSELLVERAGTADVDELKARDFETFFKLAAPKVIAHLLNEEDWYIDSSQGIRVYQFEREPGGLAPYRLLHLAMQVRRCDPRKDQRIPGAAPSNVAEEYAETVRRLFRERETIVSFGSIDTPGLLSDLERIHSRGENIRKEDH